MPGKYYDKTARELMKDMLFDIGLQPGQILTRDRAVQWFAERYPLFKATNIRAHLQQASTNDVGRLSHPSTTASDDLLFKVATNQYRLYEPGKDPAPVRERFPGDVAEQVRIDEEAAEDEEVDLSGHATSQASSEFLLERDLQLYLAKNLDRIEPGMRLYEDEGIRGIEYEASGGRRIDILAVDRAGALVVLELKVSKGYDRVVGQLMRYVNWVRLNLADPGQNVRGIIVCRHVSVDLQLACASLPEVELFEYQLTVNVTRQAPLVIPGG